MKNILVCLLLLWGLLVSATAQAEIYALIMTIGDYQGGIPKLKGVKYDADSARKMAHLLGATDENILQFHDEQLTLEGMQHAFDELDRRVAPGDKVFIYYSGHGGRQLVHEPEERCAESIVTVNGYGLIDLETERRLKKLSERTQKIIAMFDSCYSGGLAKRGLSNPLYTPKFWSKGGVDSCEKPVNVITRSLRSALPIAGSGAKNYVYIAAAKDDEVSFDQQGKGGMATQAWLQCMSGDAVDKDKSGGLSVEEIQACAQGTINAQMKGDKGFLPQHISVTGNSQLVMTLVSKDAEVVTETEPETEPEMQPVAEVQQEPEAQPTPEAQPVQDEQPVVQITHEVPPALVVQPVPVPQPTPDVQPAHVVQTNAESGASATLSDIYNGRDDRRTVEIIPTQSNLTIGNDKFSFSVYSSNAGYLYLLMVGSDGKTFDLLFPNKLDGDNHIQTGQTLQFPRSSWEVTAQGPVGKDHILAIVADAPRDLSKLMFTNPSPFSEVSASEGGKRGIHLVTSSSSAEVQHECSDARKRNLALQQVCSDAYGAALTEVEETKAEELFSNKLAESLRYTDSAWKASHKKATRSLAAGPDIVFEKPVQNTSADGIITINSPSDLEIAFKEKQSPVDMGSLDISAEKGFFSVSLTSKLKPYIQGNRIVARNLEIPKGKFVIVINVADQQGKKTSTSYRMQVM